MLDGRVARAYARASSLREVDVLFGIIYRERTPTEEGQKRSLELFQRWQPPIEFKGHWAFATGGGMAVFEADTAAAVVESTVPWTPYFEFRIEPVVEIEQAVPIYAKTQAWRDSS
jgi:Domain of unknown function (DUF3303)